MLIHFYIIFILTYLYYLFQFKIVKEWQSLLSFHKQMYLSAGGNYQK